MMNESHAGTARAALPLSWAKRGLVSLFDSALVGGRPQQRYFAALGMAEDEIFTGYDAVDNGYFAQQAETVRVDAAACRRTHQLPPRYFLSLGRFVPKKNLPALIHAYRLFLNANPQSETHLVMVGAGPEDFQLRAQCVKLGLQVHEKSHIPERAPASGKWEQQRGSKPGVHFYGFRQIKENPLFYALAEAFILPSLYEEWGLVVNEAMASGLPVIVSERAGCAEDLLEKGFPENATFTSISVRRAGLRSKIRRNGFVFDPHSPEELSRVLGLLSSVAELRIAMGRASRVIVEKFSCENFGRNAWLAAQAAIEKQRSPAPAPARGELMIPPA
ncbi:MAG: glycosyltransferase family 4 protein, partial [Akkermansiaceae bacterium]|nr:glycosyltransferase family 4 protein [Verrucomicrobiales bacterium]